MKLSRLIVAGGLGVSVVSTLGLVTWARESRTDHVVERARTALEASWPLTSDAPAVTERLDGLDALFANCDPDVDSITAPWTWQPSHDGDLREALEQLATLFDEVDDVLSDAAVARSLQVRQRLDRRTSLLWARSRTNLLCAKAIIEARDGHDGEAARRLGQALDLLLIDCDPSSIELMIQASLQRIVFDALRELLAVERVDARILEAQLVPRLDAALRGPTWEDCLRGDALAVATGENADAEGASERIETWRKSGVIARLAALADGSLVRPSARTGVGESAAELDALFLSSLAAVETERLRRLEFARLALSLAAEHDRNGEWSARETELTGIGTRLHDAYTSAVVVGDELRLCAGLAGPNGSIEVWLLR